MDDAKKYLADEVATYRISDYRFGPKSEEAIRHALERYSIPQVRRHIKKVVEKTSALSNRHDFNRRHALNTIPGNLVNYVDRSLSEQWNIYPVLFDWDAEEPVLLRVLFNRVLGVGLTGFR